jgi:hypothetical protein
MVFGEYKLKGLQGQVKIMAVEIGLAHQEIISGDMIVVFILSIQVLFFLALRTILEFRFGSNGMQGNDFGGLLYGSLHIRTNG